MIIKVNKFYTKILIIILIFFLDRVSKIYVLDLFQNNNVQELVITNFLNIYLIFNEGIAFGLLSFDSFIIYNSLTLLIAIVSLIILIYAFKIKNYSSYFFTIIFAGAIGNLYDRIRFSAVPDFIDFHIGNYHWFIFNVADIFISIGIMCLILDEFFFNKLDDEKT